ncbi:MAG: hypothetical protein ACFFDS_06320 [Candidatus Thorarchaeota archaeon]
MDSNSSKPVSVKANYVVPDEVELPNFDFENLIIEHYRKYPRTAALVENPTYVKAIMQPFRRFYLVPLALFKLKLNTILSLRWKEYLKLWIYVVIMFIPTLLFTIIPLEKAFESPGRWIADILFNVGIPILIAVLLSLFYLKYTHDGFLGLTLAKRIEWLEKPIREYYTKYYDRKLPKNPLIIIASLATGIGIQIPLIQFSYEYGYNAAAAFGIIACIFNPVLFYIFFVATYYMIVNTRLYSKVLKPIKDRIKIYMKEYGTLLNRENYDIIWSLGDKWSKGRSIRQLENIPTAGILSTLIIIIAMGMGNANELIYALAGEMPSVNVDFLFIHPPQPVTVIVVTISAVVAALMVLIVLLPLIIFHSRMKKFKIKALMELDNYIFANVVEFEIRYAEVAKQENVTMFQLREYIASMRTFPISTSKLFRTIVAVIIWILNMIKIIKSVGGGGVS